MPSTEPTAAERAAVERPILFSAPMVRAILEDRKAQTRRVMKPQPRSGQTWGDVEESEQYIDEWFQWFDGGSKTASFSCPYGAPGDRLWVRETLRPSQSQVVTYAEDGCPAWRHGESVTWPWPKTPLVRTAIFMPRWASRILLEIVEVRAQRLREISEADATEEGIGAWFEDHPHPEWDGDRDEYRKGFQELWDAINRKSHPWSSNPWVWAVSFKRI